LTLLNAILKNASALHKFRVYCIIVQSIVGLSTC